MSDSVKYVAVGVAAGYILAKVLKSSTKRTKQAVPAGKLKLLYGEMNFWRAEVSGVEESEMEGKFRTSAAERAGGRRCRDALSCVPIVF